MTLAPFASATFAAAFSITLAGAGLAEPAGEEAAVRSATEAIYAPYVAGRIGGDPQLTDSFAAAWRRALGPDGAMGYDPYCECQDFDDFSLVIRSVAVSGDVARVAVTLRNMGSATAKRLVFRKVAGRWLLDDMNDGDTASLKQDMASGPVGSYAME